ncbi:MAG: tetratricopeptide repeat protein [Rhizomicrobium sp.]
MTMNSGLIVTFFSWKGGVGRSMALANVAAQLARMGNNVLMIDWDLEAPGLDRYFTNDDVVRKAHVEALKPTDESGLLGLLVDPMDLSKGVLGADAWQRRLWRIAVPSIEPTYRVSALPKPGILHLMPSGIGSGDYAKQLISFSWAEFFSQRKGGQWLEDLRGALIQAYDFVLIDSRTGLTDSGGICTIQMPDVLVLVFTSNDESLDGGLNAVAAAQQARADFAYDRAPLMVVPLLSRWDGENEVDLADAWMKRFDEKLRPIVASWLPREFTPRRFLERTRVPHVARFSFGEPLPVLTHSLTDASLPGLSYETLARLLDSRLADAGKIIDPAYEVPRVEATYTDANRIKLLSLAADQTALDQEIARIIGLYGSQSGELAKFLSAAADALKSLAKNTEAETLYRRALAIDEQRLGPDHPEVAAYLNKLASILRDSNRLPEAEALFRRALAIDERSFGPAHPAVATDLNNLAGLLRDTNRVAEAEPLYRRSLATANWKPLTHLQEYLNLDLNEAAKKLDARLELEASRRDEIGLSDIVGSQPSHLTPQMALWYQSTIAPVRDPAVAEVARSFREKLPDGEERGFMLEKELARLDDEFLKAKIACHKRLRKEFQEPLRELSELSENIPVKRNSYNLRKAQLGRDAKVLNNPLYALGFALLIATVAFLDLASFSSMSWATPFIATGSTLIVAALVTLAAHLHGSTLKQYEFHFGPAARNSVRNSGWRQLAIGSAALSVALSFVYYARAAYLAELLASLGKVRPDSQVYNPFWIIGGALLGNVAAYLSGVSWAYLLHDHDPIFAHLKEDLARDEADRRKLLAIVDTRQSRELRQLYEEWKKSVEEAKRAYAMFVDRPFFAEPRSALAVLQAKDSSVIETLENYRANLLTKARRDGFSLRFSAPSDDPAVRDTWTDTMYEVHPLKLKFLEE